MKIIKVCFCTVKINNSIFIISKVSRDREEADYYFDLCIKSSLWVPNTKENC